MNITIKESIKNIKDTIKKSSFAKFKIVEQLPSTNNLYDTYIIEKDEKNYKMSLFRFDESVNLDIFKELNNIKDVNHLVESGQEGDRHYLLWEVLDYPNLGEVEVPIDEFLRKISTTLSNLHKKKIYHLNLNLENIKVKSTKPLEIIIDDFASASITDSEVSKKLTNVKGIDLFQSPELSLGIASSKSDYWSLGVILYYLLTKTLPEKNTYTKEILLDNIPFKYENLVKGLLSIDLNKRYGKEEIDIVLGGGKVEVDTKSTSMAFTYEGKRFNSLEDFALFLHNEKNGLDMFKKLLYRGYFDKYYDEVILSKLKNSLGELNAFFYHYGKEGQKELFEGENLYNPLLWFTHDQLKKIHYRNHSTVLFSKISDTFIDKDNIGRFTFEFQSVRDLLAFDIIKPNQVALSDLKTISFTKINYREVQSGKNKTTEYAINYLFLQELIKEDKELKFLRLSLPYDEIKEVPREELSAYIQYKYIFDTFRVNGFVESVDIDAYFDNHLFELKHYLKHKSIINYKISYWGTLYKSIKKIKRDRDATKYYLKYSDDNDLIREVNELEVNQDFFSYFSFVNTNHLNVKKESKKLNAIDRIILILSEIYSDENRLENFIANLNLKNLKFIYENINNKDSLKNYLKKIFKKTNFNCRKSFNNNQKIDEILLNFDYNIDSNLDDNRSFENFTRSLEDFLSLYQFETPKKSNSLLYDLDHDKSLKNIHFITVSVILIILFLLFMDFFY